tara:strand:+ start:18 stop:203 length:186 start_codon:yes stop_codon:yes gene_type:complete
VANALETANFDFSFYVLSYVSAEIAFNGVVLVYEVSHFDDFFISQIANPSGSTNVQRFTYI